MPTFTVTTSSSKIDISAGTGTLAQLYADISASGTMTNPSANVYEVAGNRELEISGATLTIEAADTLQWNRTSNGTAFDVQSSGKVIFEDGATLNNDTNGTHMGYNYFYGGLDVQGTSGTGVLWDFCGRNYFYPYGLNNMRHTVAYLTIRNLVNANSYGLFFLPSQITLDETNGNHTYENITIEAGPSEATGNGWLAYWNSGSYHNYTFNNIDLTNGNGFLCYGTANLLITGGTAINGDLDHRYYGQVEGMVQSHYNTVRDDTHGKKAGNHNNNQNKTCFKNYTFDDGDLGVFTGGTVDRGGVAYFDSCTFQNASSALNVDGHAVLYNPTFTSISGSKYSYTTARNGTVLHARKIWLTVLDNINAAIEDATVTFRQKEGREHWVCKTDANGAVLDPHGEPIWLIENEETNNGVFTQWSDGTGDQIHVIEIYKDGYDPHVIEVAMTEDKTIQVNLQPEGTNVVGTVINNSTLNNATIY